MGNSLSPETIAALRNAGYISSQQAMNPASIPQSSGQPDWSNPQFAGLHPPANNAMDRAALAAATPDLSRGTNAQGQVNPGVDPTFQGANPNIATAPPVRATAAPATTVSTKPDGSKGPGDFVFNQAPTTAGVASALPSEPKPMVIPGHTTPTVSPDQMKQFQGAMGAQLAAADQSATAEVNQNDVSAKALDRIAQGVTGQVAQMQQREQGRRDALQAQQDEYDSMRRDAANGTPDYDQWMKQGGASRRILSGLAMGLGAFSNAITKTGNPGMQIIQASIERNIAQQRDALAQKQKGAQAEGESLNTMRQRFGDDRIADAAEYAKQLEAYKLAGDAEVQKAGSPVLAAKWATTRAGILQQQAGLNATLQKWTPAMSTAPTYDQELARAEKRAQIAKTEAETGKTSAEAANIGGGGAAGAADLAAEGSNLPSTNFLAHPINATTRALGIQGTEGFKAGQLADAHNARLEGMVHAKFGARSPEAMKALAAPYMARPNDTAETLRTKAMLAQRAFGAPGTAAAQAAAQGVIEPE